MRSPRKFAQLLTDAIYKIRTEQSKVTKKTLAIIQDELGYALGREGGSSIEYWRKGHIPGTIDDIEQLARELVKRGGLNKNELTQFLDSAAYPTPPHLSNELFPVSTSQELAPFVIGPPISHPRQFFGREPELRRIFGVWKHAPLQNVAIIGPYRSGKTSLLRYIETITQTPANQLRPGQRHNWLPQPEQYRWVFVDFQNALMCSRAELLHYILTCLKLPIPDPCDLKNFIEVMSQHLHHPAIILMDEIAAGLASPDLDQQFWWSLRSLGSNYTNGKLGFLLTAHEIPAVLAQEYGKPSPFFNIFGHTIKLGPLTDSAAQELIVSSPQPFSLEAATWILAQSGRWPALLQILCDTYFIALEEGMANSVWQEEGLQRIAPYRYLLD